MQAATKKALLFEQTKVCRKTRERKKEKSNASYHFELFMLKFAGKETVFYVFHGIFT